MPALITHHLFGEESIDRLPQGAGEAPPGATVTFLPRGKAASIARASGGFASAPSHS